jgi:hypothetical protein
VGVGIQTLSLASYLSTTTQASAIARVRWNRRGLVTMRKKATMLAQGKPTLWPALIRASSHARAAA